MMGRPHSAIYGLMLLSFLVFAGCPPPTTTRPETASSSASQAPAGQGSVSEQSAARGAPQGQQARAPSSLEALRRGEGATTPASSPLKEIYFDYDRHDLRADARATLKGNADWLKDNPSVRIEIEGHCDERGTNEYNLALGAKRAQAAKDYLVSLGITANRLSTISYGEEVPVCKEQNEECWQKNRRDRFVIVPTRPAS